MYRQIEKKTHLHTLPKTTKSAVDMEDTDIEVEPYEETASNAKYLNSSIARSLDSSTMPDIQTTICDPILVKVEMGFGLYLSTSVPWPALRHELAWEERALVVSDRNGRASTMITSQLGSRSDGSCIATNFHHQVNAVVILHG